MPSPSKQRLALAICDFLSTSLTDGTLTAEEKDSIDIAVNCISESFGVDPTDTNAVSQAVGSQNLAQIYSVYERLKNNTPASSASTTSPKATPTPSAPAAEPTEDQKKQAEGLKSKGNTAMAQKDYPAAIDLYTQALALHPNNAIFLSNRAAAHSAARDHEAARADADAAVAVDPKYTKAWSRLGLARFALGDAKGAMEAYQKGIEYEGNGGSEAMKKGFETAKRRVDEITADETAASAAASPRGGAGSPGGGGLGDLAGLFGGGAGAGGAGGAGGGGGGMPDFASIMNNPMFASMAQNLMSNPDMMANLMNNPRLREMADQFGRGGGGGMPDLGSLMSDPSVAEMARNLMGGAGRGGPGGPGAGR
ncbi:hsc70 cochaperone [Chaetomium sp. MPI-SDFR-AT-0129]|nr:hsc70 cochaperone [Chaetomium sp. MPI-SDFR-AT-0129]